MSVFLNNGVSLMVNSVDLSDHVESVTLNQQADELETTAMGDTGHQFVAGLESNSVTINFYNDAATGKVLQTLQAAYKTKVTCVLKNQSGAVSATNPSYTFSALINKLTPINGKVSELSTQSVTWTISGAIAVATS